MMGWLRQESLCIQAERDASPDPSYLLLAFSRFLGWDVTEVGVKWRTRLKPGMACVHQATKALVCLFILSHPSNDRNIFYIFFWLYQFKLTAVQRSCQSENTPSLIIQNAYISECNSTVSLSAICTRKVLQSSNAVSKRSTSQFFVLMPLRRVLKIV